MLSRVAGSIYWMSRYLERADNVARFIYVNVHLLLDLGLAPDNAQWKPLIEASGDEDSFSTRYDAPTEANVIRFLTLDEENPNSILSSIRRARENARTVREIISSEMWETINELYHFIQEEARAETIADLQGFCQRIRTGNHLFCGLAENTMSHGEGWHFARLGRMLERADKTARILDVKYFLLLPGPEYIDTPYDSVQWGAVLKSANAFEMYRKQFHRVNYRDVARFLILDAEFPRAMRHSIDCALDSLGSILTGDGTGSAAKRELSRLRDSLHGLRIETVLAEGLHEFIDRFQQSLNTVDQAIFTTFFALR